MTLADRIVVLKDGRVEPVGTPMELYHHPGNLFVAQFIGSPAMNIVPAIVEKAGATTKIAITGGLKADVPVATPADANGASISFGVRPEDLRLAPGDNVLFEGRIDYIEQLGEVQLVYLDIGRSDTPLVVKLPGYTEVKRDQVLKVDADPGTLHIFNAEGRSFARVAPAAKAA
jgi:multiple sugar transport system ATP-binding protein/alpha-glucoside transport system ATP-binding protein